MVQNRAFIIAGPQSGAGKTTFALGIMEALRRRGFCVQPFKSGPDYIDPQYHSLLLQRPSYNLDTWMMGKTGVKKAFSGASSNAHFSVIEGAMGLFDGEGGTREPGSAAHLAKTLDIPVLMVVNAEKAARSIAALVKGFTEFDPLVKIRWVVFNKVNSQRHFEMLKTSTEKATKVKVLGFMPKDDSIKVPERHLGLFTAGEFREREWKGFLDRLVSNMEKHIDIDELLKSPPKKLKTSGFKKTQPKVRIAVARDKAFSFYYEENLEILRSFGAELVFFSPLKDKKLPLNISGIYIGGGYPELYAEELEKNPLMAEIKGAALKGLPIFAECGGLMYLGKSIEKDAKASKMSGVFPWKTRMLARRKALGYREVRADAFGFHGRLRGHEFHYSELSGIPGKVEQVFSASHKDPAKQAQGYMIKNSLATYMHIHFRSNPAFAKAFVRACASSRLL